MLANRTRAAEKAGAGRMVRLRSPSITSLRPVSRSTSAVIRPFWVFQSMKLGPTRTATDQNRDDQKDDEPEQRDRQLLHGDFSYRSLDPRFPPANCELAIARGEVSSKLKNVGLLGNVAVPNGPIGLRNTRPAMGEIVDLERYRKLRRRREAMAEKVKRGDVPDDGKTRNPSAPPAVKRAGPGHTESKGAAKTGDDPKTD